MAEDLQNGYYASACRKRKVTRLTDITANDFVVSAIATAASGAFNVAVTIEPKKPFGDVKTITQSGNAIVYDDDVRETNPTTDTGVNTTGTPAKLTITAVGMAQTSTNVGNTWKVKFINLVVVGKDGQTFTLPTLYKTFPSPL